LNIGYEVETASRGVDCMGKLRRKPPGVLLLDLGIPWGGGEGVLAAMRDDRNLREIPVLLIPVAGEPPAIQSLVPLPVVEAMIQASLSGCGGRALNSGESPREKQTCPEPAVLLGRTHVKNRR
jgi:hypothetical protein